LTVWPYPSTLWFRFDRWVWVGPLPEALPDGAKHIRSYDFANILWCMVHGRSSRVKLPYHSSLNCFFSNNLIKSTSSALSSRLSPRGVDFRRLSKGFISGSSMCALVRPKIHYNTREWIRGPEFSPRNFISGIQQPFERHCCAAPGTTRRH